MKKCFIFVAFFISSFVVLLAKPNDVKEDEGAKMIVVPGKNHQIIIEINKFCTGENPETLKHEPLAEFEKLYENKPFPSNDDEMVERKKRSPNDKSLIVNNKNKMDENIKKIGDLPKNSKFLGTKILLEQDNDR